MHVFYRNNTGFTKPVWKDDVSILNHEEHDVSIKNLQNKGSVWVPEVNGYICKQGSFWTWVFDPPHVLLQGSIQAKGLVIGHEQA